MLYSILAFGLFIGKGGGGFDGYVQIRTLHRVRIFCVLSGEGCVWCDCQQIIRVPKFALGTGICFSFEYIF